MLIVLRGYEVDVVTPREQAVDRFLHLRVEVYRVNELYIWVAQGQFGQGQADTFETGAEVFPTMAGDQHHALIVVQFVQG
ncbi:hypothetical protein D3C80_2092980 [compost metagenome]